MGETARDERDGALDEIGAGALRCISNLGSGSSCADDEVNHRSAGRRGSLSNARTSSSVHAWMSALSVKFANLSLSSALFPRPQYCSS